jgi:2'-5' RNA ligase
MKTIYDNMWRQALPLLKNGQVDTDSLIISKNDTRRGLTLIFRPPAELLDNIQTFLNEARSVEPSQYFYPRSDLHLTVLSIISCYPGFHLNQIKQADYHQLIEVALQKINSFRLTFRGITASPAGVMVQGFDENGQLDLLRESLRDNFKISNLEHSIDKRYKLQTAHLTVIRFAKKLSQPAAFAALAEAYRNEDFGTCQVHEMELVFNDWYQRKENTVVTKTFRLEGVSQGRG